MAINQGRGDCIATSQEMIQRIPGERDAALHPGYRRTRPGGAERRPAEANPHRGNARLETYTQTLYETWIPSIRADVYTMGRFL